jgi:hypothetical protein
VDRGSRLGTRKPALEALERGLLFREVNYGCQYGRALFDPKMVGPDDKITDMSAFYDALVKALTDAHKEGQDEAFAELETTDAASTAR